MSDVPRLRRTDPDTVEQVSETLSSFSEQVSILGENVNGLKKSQQSIPKSTAGRDQEEISVEGMSSTEIAPRRSSLLQHGGVIGASIIWLGDLLTEDKKPTRAEGGGEGGKGILETAAGVGIGRALVGGIKGLFTVPNLLKLGGGAIFAGLTIHDLITAGLPEFQEGDIIGGIVNTLLGKPPESDADVALGMLKQTGKWAGFGLMVAGPIGAAIAGGIGLLVGGIRAAIIRGWDEETEETSESVRDALFNEELNTFEWAKTVFGGLFKNLFGVLGAGVQSVWDNVRTRFESMGEILQQESFSILDPFRLIGNFIRAFIGIGFDFLKGIVEPLTDAILGFFPDDAQERLRGFWGRVKEFAFEKGSGARRLKENIGGRIQGFLSGIGIDLGGFLNNIRERGGVEGITNAAFQTATDAVKQFFTDTVSQISDFFGGIFGGEGEEFNLQDWIEEAVEKVRSFFIDAIASIGEFFEEVGQAVNELLSLEDLGENLKGLGERAGEAIGDTAGRGVEFLKGLFDRNDEQKVDDAIIRPDGSLIRTHPDDTLVALKSLSSSVGTRTDDDITAIQRSQMAMQSSQNSQMLRILESINKNLGNRERGNQVFQQNITSAFAPQNIMQSLSAVGEL